VTNELKLTDRYLIGIKQIDTQHQVLVDLLNKLHKAILTKGSEEEVKDIINQFVDYTVYHFKEEEILMMNNGYPKLQSHIKIHEKIVANVSKVLKDFENSRFLRFKFFTLAMDVLMNHIEIEDNKFAKYMEEKESIT
jgi:hemerythrin